VFQPLNASVRWSKGRLVYDARVSPARFTAWTQTKTGRAAIAAMAANVRFAPLGKMRAARRRLWWEIAAAARDDAVCAAIQREIDGYLNLICDLAFGEGLPRASVQLHRLVVVPGVLINTAVYRGLARRLASLPAVASLNGGDHLREFFFVALVDELEAAIARAAPSPKRPLLTDRGWMSIGINRAFVWRIPFEAPTWAGHHYLFEVTRQPITRATRTAMVERIRAFESSLPSLSTVQRSDILRRASAA
jgi:hypothetical protein